MLGVRLSKLKYPLRNAHNMPLNQRINVKNAIRIDTNNAKNLVSAIICQKLNRYWFRLFNEQRYLAREGSSYRLSLSC